MKAGAPGRSGPAQSQLLQSLVGGRAARLPTLPSRGRAQARAPRFSLPPTLPSVTLDPNSGVTRLQLSSIWKVAVRLFARVRKTASHRLERQRPAAGRDRAVGRVTSAATSSPRTSPGSSPPTPVAGCGTLPGPWVQPASLCRRCRCHLSANRRAPAPRGRPCYGGSLPRLCSRGSPERLGDLCLGRPRHSARPEPGSAL